MANIKKESKQVQTINITHISRIAYLHVHIHVQSLYKDMDYNLINRLGYCKIWAVSYSAGLTTVVLVLENKARL